MVSGYDVKLSKLSVNIKKHVIWLLLPFVSFLQMFEPRKVHNMLCFMLDLEYKNLCFMYFFIGLQEGIEVVWDYDKRSQCR